MTSSEEKVWLKKFYEGTFLVKGWNAQTKALLQDYHGEERSEISDLLSNLGDKIGREWAKDNAVRRIDTAMLQQWGASLTQARRKGTDALTEEIRTIGESVDGLLS